MTVGNVYLYLLVSHFPTSCPVRYINVFSDKKSIRLQVNQGTAGQHARPISVGNTSERLKIRFTNAL